MAKRKKKRWIQSAIKHPGALKALAKKEGALSKSGKIKSSWLREKARGSGTVARRARLAITLRKLRRRRKK